MDHVHFQLLVNYLPSLFYVHFTLFILLYILFFLFYLHLLCIKSHFRQICICFNKEQPGVMDEQFPSQHGNATNLLSLCCHRNKNIARVYIKHLANNSCSGPWETIEETWISKHHYRFLRRFELDTGQICLIWAYFYLHLFDKMSAFIILQSSPFYTTMISFTLILDKSNIVWLVYR